MRRMARLDLADNSIGSAGAGAIAQFLSASVLKELVLDMNQLGVEGARHLASALPSCPSLDALVRTSVEL